MWEYDLQKAFLHLFSVYGIEFLEEIYDQWSFLEIQNMRGSGSIRWKVFLRFPYNFPNIFLDFGVGHLK